MDGEAIQELKKLADQAAEVVTVGEQDYSRQKLLPLETDIWEAELVQLSSLSSLADYLGANKDQLELNQIMVQLNPGDFSIEVFSAVRGKTRTRHHIAKVSPISFTPYPIGEVVEHEDFHLLSRATIYQTPERDELIELMKGVRTQNGKEVELRDNGLGQDVKASISAGSSVMTTKKVKPYWNLTFYRGYTEIYTPETLDFLSQAVFVRLNKDGGILIKDADGGAWRINYVKQVKKYLREVLPNEVTLL